MFCVLSVFFSIYVDDLIVRVISSGFSPTLKSS